MLYQNIDKDIDIQTYQFIIDSDHTRSRYNLQKIHVKPISFSNEFD